MLLAQTTATYLRAERVPLSGGAMAQYTYAGLSVYLHPDWLGSSRLESTPWPVAPQPTLVSVDPAIAPFGEQVTTRPLDTLGANERLDHCSRVYQGLLTPAKRE